MGWYTFVRFFGLRGENVKAIAWGKKIKEGAKERERQGRMGRKNGRGLSEELGLFLR